MEAALVWPLRIEGAFRPWQKGIAVWQVVGLTTERIG